MAEQIFNADLLTKRDYDELLKGYKQAVKNDKTQFIFRGQDCLVSYAFYLLQYLEPKFKHMK
jgi:hypothetical protein